MKTLKMLLDELIVAANEWSKFTYSHGKNHKSYCDEEVHCYHADDSRHRTVKFGRYPHQIEVAFLEPPTVSGNVGMLCRLEEVTAKARSLLAAEHKKEALRSREEKEAEKQARIAALQEQLSELTGAA